MRKLPLLTFALLVALASAAWAGDQSADPHLVAARLTPICRRSAFLHGYLHGYERGFQAADLDLQMGRTRLEPPPANDSGYRPEFGDKGLFRAGYKSGLLTGYADGAAGRRFRAVAVVLEAFGPVAVPDTADLDRALRAGYSAGQKRGLSDGRNRLPFQTQAGDCRLSLRASDSIQFCDAFARGYRMGYSDGYVNQQPLDRQTTAKK